MRYFLAGLLFALWSTGTWAQSADCGATGPVLKSGEIKLVSCDIQELATAIKWPRRNAQLRRHLLQE
jgi:hypothetical protein